MGKPIFIEIGGCRGYDMLNKGIIITGVRPEDKPASASESS